ncbi:hypothetical protein [Streptomyces botrytidirepellens]|uniref:Uncharacterized protein n=1 Tax=Streptomyces botrytidirepellens TaxID=2486417 RepID=A0A3M8VLI6_9ACTN|nr:hypothetical protein [Streptomyces botrytidirepellens]RNG18518.1 hypothetical protein EEJ42_26145 [Streptomyces botrytidirepellens]
MAQGSTPADGLTPDELALFRSPGEPRGYAPATEEPEPEEAPQGPAGASSTASSTTAPLDT